MGIVLKAKAKVNLLLYVTGKRLDGYHTLETIMHEIDLYDDVAIEKCDNIIVHCDNSMLCGCDNICYKASTLFFQYTNINGGCNINIKKRIPLQAGLGGGSADAAATLKGLNALYNAHLTNAELCSIGEQVGADVPFLIIGGTALVCGIGEIITPIKPLHCRFIIIKPAVSICTKHAYELIDSIECVKASSTQEMVQAIECGDVQKVVTLLYNQFEQVIDDVTICEAIDVLHKAGANNAIMSGSGSSVFGIFDDDKIDTAFLKVSLKYKNVYKI